MTSLEAGRANQKIADEDLLRYATDQQRVVLTLNRRHFVRLHRLAPLHAGIVVCTVDADYHAQAARISAAVGSLQSLSNQLIRVNKPA